MSDTPRTDRIYARGRFSTDDDLRIELGDLARQLERELAALREQLAERDAELAALKAHAEAMASVLYRIRLYSNEDAVVEAYRAAYPKEIDK